MVKSGKSVGFSTGVGESNGDLMAFMVIFHGIYGGLMESNGIYPAWL